MSKSFLLGTLVSTPAALHATRNLPYGELFIRHAKGDYGSADAAVNEEAKETGDMILSIHNVDGVEVWVKTEGDRSVTTMYVGGED